MGHLCSPAPLRRLAILLLALAAACGDSSGSPQSSGSPTSPEGGLLFVLGASAARLERDANGAGRLVLRDPSHAVASFTDRPERSASTLALADFLAGWSGYGFAAVPPNVALVVEAAPDGADVAVFEIASPSFADGALTFDVVPLAGTPSAGIRALAERADPALPADLGRVALFVDDASSPITYQQIVLQVSNAAPGQTIRLELSEPDAAIGWSFGPPDQDPSGFLLTCESGSLPLTQLQIDRQELVIVTSSDGGGAATLSFAASLYLAASAPVSVFSLASASDPGIVVSVSVGNREPETVDDTPTPFEWMP